MTSAGKAASVAEVVVEALGVPVAIPTDTAHVARLRRQWSRALTARPAETTVDISNVSADDDVAGDYSVTTLVTMAALTATAGLRLNIHAGAVSDSAGRAHAVIGASGAGKTTAVVQLAQRLGYLSDETVSLDDDLVVHPHPKPLSVIGNRDAPHVKASLSPDDLGLLEPTGPARLHRIVLLRRGEEPARLEPLHPASAIVEVVAQTSSLVLLAHPVERLARTLDACGGAWSLHYSEIDDWLDPLVDLLDTTPPPTPAWVHHPPVAAVPSDPARTWRRGDWLDAVQYDDQLVLLVDDTAHLLAGLGVVAWLALASPQTTDALIDHAQTVLGEHPDAPALVRAALDELASRGLLVAPACPDD